MIQQGYAYAYTDFPFERKDEYLNHQNKAEKNKVGLWADGVCGNPESSNSVGTQSETFTPSSQLQRDEVFTNPPQTPAENKKQTPPPQPLTNSDEDSDSALGGVVIGLIITFIVLWIWRIRRKSKT